jgi:hypothetical protein
MRRPELTPKVASAIVDVVRKGAGRGAAAAAAGVPERTLLRWLERGEADPTSECGALLLRVQAAEAETELKALKIVWQASEKSWQAAAWFLERTHQDRYAIRQKVDIRSEFEAKAAVMSDQELKERRRELLAMAKRDIDEDLAERAEGRRDDDTQ